MNKCKGCGAQWIKHVESDPCLGNLPGVLFGCCGHMKENGYLLFTNGVRLEFRLVQSKVVEIPAQEFVDFAGGGKEASLPTREFSDGSR